ncbi:hypothetical protein [Flavobacterium sp.]|uniref:hypothetical protein n=1 Tax=Flavobacterium sp. TaxID=239 RepID=UPI0022C0A167|nr:hypothetical protein [Flavobacterium sp.]MCZ8228052.1 hypothetical protein [Flavobacterium sp.]
MKNVLHILVSLVFLINYGCKAQQLVQTTADVQKLKTNEQQFINKPLKYLLKELKPEIKTAWVTNEEGYSYFSFRFITLEKQRKGLESREDKVSLHVYVKEQIVDLDFEKRLKEKDNTLTNEFIQKHKNLIVQRIKVYYPKE